MGLPQQDPDIGRGGKFAPSGEAMEEEARRREALSRYCVLDTPPEEAFDRLSWLAADLLDVPYAAITLADGERAWIKSSYRQPGTGAAEEPPREVKRAESFIDQVLEADGLSPVVVTDCFSDARFQHCAISAHGGVRFLVAVPLHADGVKLGVLCCADFSPRAQPDPRLLKRLEVLAEIVVSTLEERATERARVEAAHQMELFKAGLSRSNEAIVIAEVKPGEPKAVAVYVNDACCALTGYAREELVGAPTAIFKAPEADPEDMVRFNAALAKGEDVRLEMLGCKKDGERYWAEVSGAVIRSADGSGSSYYITVQRDVTEAKRARQAATERERLMSLGERVAGMGHWHVELANHEVFWSPQLYRLFGRTPETFGPSLESIAGQTDPAQHSDLNGLMEEAIEQGESERRFRIFVNGETRIIDVRAVCEYDEQGRPAAVFGVTQDITARAALEAELVDAKRRAETAADAKAEFLANMTHELRTPLTAIVGFSELMNRLPGLRDPALAYVRRIRTASDALLAIVNDVLDFSKLESGAFELERRSFDLRDLIEEAAALVGEGAAAKGVTLDIEVSPAAPRWLIGDPNRLRQILLNLLGNAVKFTDRGGVRVSARYGSGPLGLIGLHISVADTGIGISEEVRLRLFDRFVQGDGSVSRRFGGTGLGLAISKRLVELMGGAIEVESQPGQGSTFSIFAPLEIGEAAETAEATFDEAELGSLHVLLADDSEANRALLSTILAAAGVRVHMVENGAEAVRAVETGAFDLVLMDVHMPVMDGVEATRRIRALGPAYARLPIVALTANVLPEQVATYRAAGMDDHLGKPVRPPELLATVAKWAPSAPSQDAAVAALRA